MSEAIVYINGEYFTKQEAKISVYDHGFLYGDGIFEGIRIYNQEVFKCEEHINRLYDGAKSIALEIPVDKGQMIRTTREAAAKSNIKNGYIRLIVSRGTGDLGINPLTCKQASIVIIVDKIQIYPKEMYDSGMKVITAVTRRNSPASLDPQLKSLNYLNNILAKIEANHAGAAEAIMLNQNGFVCECTGDNIFIVKQGSIYTPPVHLGALNGITRNTVIDLAGKMGLDVQEKELTMTNVYSADEVFLTGTAAEIIGVAEVDKRIIANGVVGNVTKKLADNFRSVL